MIRRTVQREAVLSAVRASRTHLTVDEVYEESRKTLPHMSKGTVYRNLRLLRESGQVSELDGCGTVDRFEGRLEPHYHFRCVHCGKVFDLDEPVHAEMDRIVSERTGFEVHGHCLEFHGLCRDCRHDAERQS